MKSFFRYLGISVATIVAFFAVAGFASFPGSFMDIDVFHSSAEEKPSEFDLAIRGYNLSSSANQNSGLDYSITVEVLNQGDDIKNQQVLLNVEPTGQKFLLLRKDGTFSLKKGDTHVGEFVVSVPEYVSEQGLAITVQPLSFADQNSANNKVKMNITEAKVGLEKLRIRQWGEDTKFSWMPKADALKSGKAELRAYRHNIPNDGDNYFEADNATIGYSVSTLDRALLSMEPAKIWDIKNVRIDAKDLNKSLVYVVVLKDEENSFSSYSDMLIFTASDLLSRAEFARLVADDLKLINQNGALVYYEDVDASNPFYKSIQALFAAGIAKAEENFRPSDILTRREALEMLFNGFDVPFNSMKIDDSTESAESIKKIFNAFSNKDSLSLDEPASKEFIAYCLELLKANYEIL